MQKQQFIHERLDEIWADGKLSDGTAERIWEQVLDIDSKLTEIKLKL